MAEVKANVSTDMLQKLVAEHAKCSDYLARCAKKLKPYRERLKQTKVELTAILENLPQKVIQVDDDEYLKVECRNKKLPMSKARIESKIREFFANQPEMGESLLEYMNRVEYEPVNALRKRKGVYKADDDEDELDFADLENGGPDGRNMDDDDEDDD